MGPAQDRPPFVHQQSQAWHEPPDAWLQPHPPAFEVLTGRVLLAVCPGTQKPKHCGLSGGRKDGVYHEGDQSSVGKDLLSSEQEKQKREF